MGAEGQAAANGAHVSAARLAPILIIACLALYAAIYLRVRAVHADYAGGVTFFGPGRGEAVLYWIFWPAGAIDRRCTGRMYVRWADFFMQ